MMTQKHELVIKEWIKCLDRRIKRTNDSMECFRKFKELDDIDRVIEDAENLLNDARFAREVLNRIKDVEGGKVYAD